MNHVHTKSIDIRVYFERHYLKFWTWWEFLFEDAYLERWNGGESVDAEVNVHDRPGSGQQLLRLLKTFLHIWLGSV